jgi:DNA polymerase-4
MFLHLHVPGFHAAVHQALDATLRGHPVAVAVDAGDQAALFDVSQEAAAAHIWPGVRVAAARRRCPRLHVVTPQPTWYHRAHRALQEAAVAAAPRVGGRPGSLDVDLTGTEGVWRQACGSVDAQVQAGWWAARLHHQIRQQLHLPVSIGVAGRVRIARLAALAARSHADGLCRVPLGAELTTIAPWPVRWLRDLSYPALQALAACGMATIGAVAALPEPAMRHLLGAEADFLVTLLAGADEPTVPVLDTPSREVAATVEAGVAGADAAQAELLVRDLAREVGFRLRADGSACTRLTLSGTWLDGRTASRSSALRRQLCHDDALAQLAVELLQALQRRVAWDGGRPATRRAPGGAAAPVAPAAHGRRARPAAVSLRSRRGVPRHGPRASATDPGCADRDPRMTTPVSPTTAAASTGWVPTRANQQLVEQQSSAAARAETAQREQRRLTALGRRVISR